LVKGLFVDAILFRPSHSNLILNFRRSEKVHFAPVHHFHQFVFRHPFEN
jgi:hypothetical protein